MHFTGVVLFVEHLKSFIYKVPLQLGCWPCNKVASAFQTEPHFVCSKCFGWFMIHHQDFTEHMLVCGCSLLCFKTYPYTYCKYACSRQQDNLLGSRLQSYCIPRIGMKWSAVWCPRTKIATHSHSHVQTEVYSSSFCTPAGICHTVVLSPQSALDAEKPFTLQQHTEAIDR